MLFAQSVYFHLRPDRTEEFSQTMENEVIPLLRRQKGFQDEMTLIVPGGREAMAISLWDQRGHVDAYTSRTHPKVLRMLAKFFEGTPQVQAHEVSNSTFHYTTRGLSWPVSLKPEGSTKGWKGIF